MDKAKKSKGKILYIVTMAVLIVIFTVAIFQQYIIHIDLNKEKSQVLTEISKEEAIGNSLKNQKENMYDAENIEKLARERLNMVKPNEIVFIDKNSQNSAKNENTTKTTETQNNK